MDKLRFENFRKVLNIEKIKIIKKYLIKRIIKLMKGM